MKKIKIGKKKQNTLNSDTKLIINARTGWDLRELREVSSDKINFKDGFILHINKRDSVVGPYFMSTNHDGDIIMITPKGRTCTAYDFMFKHTDGCLNEVTVMPLDRIDIITNRNKLDASYTFLFKDGTYHSKNVIDHIIKGDDINKYHALLKLIHPKEFSSLYQMSVLTFKTPSPKEEPTNETPKKTHFLFDTISDVQIYETALSYDAILKLNQKKDEETKTTSAPNWTHVHHFDKDGIVNLNSGGYLYVKDISHSFMTGFAITNNSGRSNADIKLTVPSVLKSSNPKFIVLESLIDGELHVSVEELPERELNLNNSKIVTMENNYKEIIERTINRIGLKRERLANDMNTDKRSIEYNMLKLNSHFNCAFNHATDTIFQIYSYNKSIEYGPFFFSIINNEVVITGPDLKVVTINELIQTYPNHGLRVVKNRHITIDTKKIPFDYLFTCATGFTFTNNEYVRTLTFKGDINIPENHNKLIEGLHKSEFLKLWKLGYLTVEGKTNIEAGTTARLVNDFNKKFKADLRVDDTIIVNNLPLVVKTDGLYVNNQKADAESIMRYLIDNDDDSLGFEIERPMKIDWSRVPMNTNVSCKGVPYHYVGLRNGSVANLFPAGTSSWTVSDDADFMVCPLSELEIADSAITFLRKAGVIS